LAAGFCPKNLAFDRKIMVLPSLAAAPQTRWLVHLWLFLDEDCREIGYTYTGAVIVTLAYLLSF